MAKQWKDTKGRDKGDRWDAHVDVVELEDGGFKTVRPVGEVTTALIHWISVKTKQGEKKAFPAACIDWNADTEGFVDAKKRKCPACRCKTGVRDQTIYLGNAIDRDIQENKPGKARMSWEIPEEKDNKYRNKGDESWSPIRVMKLPATAAEQVRDVVKLNIHKTNGKRQTYDVSDPEYGCDLHIKFDSSVEGSQMYNVQKGDPTPLTKKEKKLKLFKLKGLIKPPELEDLTESLVRLGYLDAKGKPTGGENTMVSRKKLMKFAEEVGLAEKKAKKLDDDELKEALLKKYDEDNEDDYSKALKQFKSEASDDDNDNDNNDNDNNDNDDLDEMDEEELLAFAKKKGLKLDKKEKKLSAKKLRKAIAAKLEEGDDDNDDNDNDNDDNDNDNDDNDNDNDDNDDDNDNDDDDDDDDNDDDDDDDDKKKKKGKKDKKKKKGKK